MHNTMKVTIKRQAFLEALAHQQNLIERRSTSPILTHVLLESDGEKLFLKGTDLEMSVVESIACETAEPGSITVSVHTLYDIIRKFSGMEDIHLSQKNDMLSIKSGRADFSLPTLPPEEFPAIHPEDLPHKIMLPAQTFKDLVDRTRFAMSSEEARQSLNSMCFHVEGQQWRAVATDAHRLAMSWILFSAEEQRDFPTILVGRKAIQEINRLLESCREDVEISFSTKQIMVRFAHITFSSRLLEGRFPHYWEAIPKDHPYSISLEVKPFMRIIDRVGMMSSETQNKVVLHFSPGELVVSAQSSQYGSGKEVMDIQYDGAPVVLGFNPRYLLDICQHIKGTFLKLIVKDTLSPSIILDTDNDHALYLLMPVHL